MNVAFHMMRAEEHGREGFGTVNAEENRKTSRYPVTISCSTKNYPGNQKNNQMDISTGYNKPINQISMQWTILVQKQEAKFHHDKNK